MKPKKAFLTALLFLSGILTFGWRTDAVQAEETYQISTDLTFPPFEFQNENNEYVGIDVDLLKAIAADQGFEVKLRPLGFDSSIQGVQSGQLDGMIAGMSITEERKSNFDFSDSYFDSGIQMAVARDETTIKSYADLKDKTVAAKVGTESAAFLQENQQKYGYTMKNYDAADALYNALTSNKVQAIFDDYPVLGYAISNGQPLKLIGDPQKGNAYGFAVKKGTHQELLKKFNIGLAKLKADGTYQKIVDNYISAGSSDSNPSQKNESTFMGLLQNNWQSLLKGLGRTVALALISFALATIVGIIFGLFSVAPIKALRTFTGLYVDLIRGIPMMVLAIFIFFGLPFNIPDFVAGIITLTLNASAYIAELVRGGINAVPKGQMEASRSLGLSYTRTMQKIILPQAVKIMIPSFVNQFVITLKDTTIISVIGVAELLQTGKIIVARTSQSTYTYLIIALIYLVVITCLTRLARKLEKKGA